jgi:hypothetical protein
MSSRITSADEAQDLLCGITPGRWVVVEDDDSMSESRVHVAVEGVDSWTDDLPDSIAAVLMQNPGRVGANAPQWDENARLIAAAPDLARSVVALWARIEALGMVSDG